jgi:hypothetical protein
MACDGYCVSTLLQCHSFLPLPHVPSPAPATPPPPPKLYHRPLCPCPPREFSADHNYLSGVLPSLASLGFLQNLDVSNNLLIGSLDTLSSCTSLMFVPQRMGVGLGVPLDGSQLAIWGQGFQQGVELWQLLQHVWFRGAPQQHVIRPQGLRV